MKYKSYQPISNYQRVSDFLIQHYQPNNRDGNWLESIWEYAYHHPYMDKGNMNLFRLWEENGDNFLKTTYQALNSVWGNPLEKKDIQFDFFTISGINSLLKSDS